MNSNPLIFAGLAVQSGGGTSATSRIVSAALPLVAFGFVAVDTRLSAVSVFIGMVTASPVVSCYLVPNDNSAGATSAPNTSPVANAIASVTNVSVSVGINSFSGFGAHALTVGATYWLVFKYVSGTSAGIYYSAAGLFSYNPSNKPSLPVNSYKWESTSAVEPVTWAVGSPMTLQGAFAFTYTSGKTVSFATTALGTDTTAIIYHTNNGGSAFKGVGQYWIAPANSSLNLVGCSFAVRKSTAAVAGGLYADFYINGSLIGSSQTIAAVDISTSFTTLSFRLPSTVRVPPGSEIMCILKSELNAGDDQNDYYYTSSMTFVDDAQTNAGLPLNGKMRRVVFADGVITKVSTKITQSALLLDQNEPFALAPLNRRKFQNQR